MIVTCAQYDKVCFDHSLFSSSFFVYLYGVCMNVCMYICMCVCIYVSTSVSNFFTSCCSDNGFLFCCASFNFKAGVTFPFTDRHIRCTCICMCIYIHRFLHSLVACIKQTKQNKTKDKESKRTKQPRFCGTSSLPLIINKQNRNNNNISQQQQLNGSLTDIVCCCSSV